MRWSERTQAYRIPNCFGQVSAIVFDRDGTQCAKASA